MIWTLIGLLAAATFGNMYFFSSKIDALGARLDARLDAVEGRIDALAARIDAHVDAHP